jgi:sporulation protein YlmC with PRC-barrel domain
MSETSRFIIGSEVACTDGVCGDLRRVVIDPVASAITHLVVEPSHRRDAGRLVPIDLVTSAAKEIQLGCTTSEFEALEAADETQFLSGGGGQLGYSEDEMHSLPYYGLATRDMGTRVGGLGMSGTGRSNADAHGVSYDHVPLGEVEVRRGDHVYASDEPVGRVQGLVINPSDHHVTHILLDEGHLWGKKRVAIPISAVKRVGAIIRLNLTKDEVGDLPPVDVDHPSDPGGPRALAG